MKSDHFLSGPRENTWLSRFWTSLLKAEYENYIVECSMKHFLNWKWINHSKNEMVINRMKVFLFKRRKVENFMNRPEIESTYS
jgi:hypothetical protein